MKTISYMVVFVCFFSRFLFGQEPEYPFPQNVIYPNGCMPSNFSTGHFESWYQHYESQSNLLQKCSDGSIATGTDDGTKVEAMGWAMIIAAYMGEKETFDGLYKFYRNNIQSHGMMAWKTTTCGGARDAGSAADGDLDVAFSLCVAAWQWGESYREEAVEVINTVEKLICDCDGTSALYPGYGSHGSSPYGGCNQTDISYYTPAFFRVFAEFTDNEAWEKLADDTYIVLNNGANDRTGLVPNWQTFEGGQSQQGQYYYGFDACRVPWRIALDYLWNGNEEAHQWCSTIAEWAYGVGPTRIVDGYDLDGSSRGRNHNMSYIGGFAVAAMCHSREVSDAFGEEMGRLAGTRYDSYWYHAYLGNCYMLAMSGNMWRPGLDTVSARSVGGNKRQEKSLSSSFTLKNIANRELTVSGVEKSSAVTLTTLTGRRVNCLTTPTGNGASIDISSVRSGCYLLSVHGKNGRNLVCRVVSVY